MNTCLPQDLGQDNICDNCASVDGNRRAIAGKIFRAQRPPENDPEKHARRKLAPPSIFLPMMVATANNGRVSHKPVLTTREAIAACAPRSCKAFMTQIYELKRVTLSSLRNVNVNGAGIGENDPSYWQLCSSIPVPDDSHHMNQLHEDDLSKEAIFFQDESYYYSCNAEGKRSQKDEANELVRSWSKKKDWVGSSALWLIHVAAILSKAFATTRGPQSL